jgi:hypothetical protein
MTAEAVCSEFTDRGDFAIEVFSALVKWASV